MTTLYPYGQQFSSPYDRTDLEIVAERSGQLLADAALEKMGSVIEALAWVTWSWRSKPLDQMDELTRECAINALINKASAAERLVWLRIDASNSCHSLDDVRWWLEAEAAAVQTRLREAA